MKPASAPAGTENFEVVDSHHHLWDPDARHYAFLDDPMLQPIRRRFGPAELDATVSSCRVTHTVVVQAAPDPSETEYLLGLADCSPRIGAVVGWIDLSSPAGAAQLERLRSCAGARWLAGVRAMAQDEPDRSWLTSEQVEASVAAVGTAGLVCDLLVKPAQLPAAVELAAALPDVQFVLDHGGKPSIADGEQTVWATEMKRLASLPNVACKVSGLVTEAIWDSWTVEQIRPYVAQLADAFGPERLMFGSDWPVCLMAASYADVFDMALTALSSALGRGALGAVFGNNARRVYRTI